MTKPNKAAFLRTCKELENGAEFNLNIVGDVYGKPFYEMLILCLLDAGEAARAIQGSINRLRMGEVPDEDDDNADLDDIEEDKEPS